MKKRLTIIPILLILFTVIACSGKQMTDTEEIILRLPDTIETISYTGLEDLRTSKLFDAFMEDIIGDFDIPELTNNIKEFYIASEGPTFALDLEEDNMSVSKTENFVNIYKGNFPTQKIKNYLLEITEFKTPVNYGGIEGLQNEEKTMLFLEKDIIALTNNRYVEIVVDAFVNNEAALSTNSRLYKEAITLIHKNQWGVTNLERLGKFNLGNYLPLTPIETMLSYMTYGVNISKEVYNIEFTVEVESKEKAKEISDLINSVLDMIVPITTQQLSTVLSEKASRDMKEMMENLQIRVSKNKLLTGFSLKESTIEELYALGKQFEKNPTTK